MKVAAPLLLPLLRSRTQGDLMAAVLLSPEVESTVTGLSHLLGVSPATVGREVARMEAAGLVSTQKRGNTRYITVRQDNAVYEPLAQLLSVTFGPVAVLRQVLAPLDGVDEAFVYGSWAARYREQAGAVPDDIDLLIVGSPRREALDAALDQAEEALRREVNARVVDRETWRADSGGFKRTVLASPRVPVVPAG